MRTQFILGAALGVGIHLAMVAPASASGCPTRHLIEDSGPEIRVAVAVPDCSMEADAERVTFVDRLFALLTGRSDGAEAAPSAPASGPAVPTPRPTTAPAPAAGGLSCTVELANPARDPRAREVQIHLASALPVRDGRPPAVSGMLDVVAVDGSNSNRVLTDFSAAMDRSGRGMIAGPRLSVGKGGTVSATITTEGGQAVGCSAARVRTRQRSRRGKPKTAPTAAPSRKNRGGPARPAPVGGESRRRILARPRERV